jgi:ketosteroid isomerase-like protein
VTTPAVIDRYFSCINAERWEEFGSLWHPEAELRAVGSRPRTGRQQIEEFYRRMFSPWREHADIPTRVLVSGDAVTVEVRFEGVIPDGRAYGFDAVDVFDVAGEEITRLTNWYDLVLVRKMLAEPPVV